MAKKKAAKKPRSKKETPAEVIKLGGPRLTKGSESSGNYGTPESLIDAVQEKFGTIAFDLAASDANFKGPAGKYFDEQADSLKQSWHRIEGLCWLNPPFTFIRPWVEKCLEESRKGANICFLVPAAVGSRWFLRYVFKEADTYFLYGRLVFTGQEGKPQPYPKDCMIVHFHPKMTGLIDIWDWRKKLPTDCEPEK